MDVYKPLYKHILMPLLAKRRGFKHLDLVPYLEESQYSPLEKIREIQWGQLKKLLDFAYETFPFYRDKYDGILMAVVTETRIAARSTERRFAAAERRSRASFDEAGMGRNLSACAVSASATGAGRPHRAFLCAA